MTPERQEILKQLALFGELYPNWRFGQMVANICFWARGPTNEAIWDTEDQEFLGALKKHLASKQQNPHGGASAE